MGETPIQSSSAESLPSAPADPAEVTATRDSRKLAAILEQLLAIDALDLAGALNEACGIVSQFLHADKSCALIRDSSSEALVAIGVSDTAMGRKERAIGMDRLPIANDGSTVEVYQTGVSHITGHADRDPIEILGFTRGLGVRSIVETPLVIGSERRGVLTAMSAHPEHFTEADLQFLTAVARFVGLVAHRGELAEEVAAAAAERSRNAASQQALVFQAFHDPLTELPNRALFLDRFGQIIARMSRQDHAVAALFLDLDRFKPLNDMLGHDGGDQILIEVANRI